MPKVSVIICTQNRVKALKEAIETVFSSPFNDYELIVIEGQSHDATHEMLLKLYTEKLIRYTYNEGNRIDARNRGWEMAKGEYVCFLDDDDTQALNRLEIQSKYLDENPDIDIVSCTTMLNSQYGLASTINNLNTTNIKNLLKTNNIFEVINFQSCMFRKLSIDKYLKNRKPFLTEAISGGEGDVLLYEILFNTRKKISNINSTIYFYNVGVAENSLTKNTIPKWYNENINDKSYKEKREFIKKLRG